jgi:hypothetical protein
MAIVKKIIMKEMEMKKKVLACLLILSLAAVTIMPMTITAAGTTTVNGTVSGPTSIDPASGIQGTVLNGVTITGLGLTGATVVSFSGTGITVSNVSVVSDTSMTITVNIAANAPIGARDITVTGRGTLTGGFTVVLAPYVTVTAPNSFTLGNMARGGFTTVQGPNGSVDTNAQNWQVTATGAASHGGKMYNGSATLSSMLQVSKDGSHWDTADSDLIYTQADGTTLSFWVQQEVLANDPVGAYTITITFTGTVQ